MPPCTLISAGSAPSEHPLFLWRTCCAHCLHTQRGAGCACGGCEASGTAPDTASFWRPVTKHPKRAARLKAVPPLLQVTSVIVARLSTLSTQQSQLINWTPDSMSMAVGAAAAGLEVSANATATSSVTTQLHNLYQGAAQSAAALLASQVGKKAYYTCTYTIWIKAQHSLQSILRVTKRAAEHSTCQLFPLHLVSLQSR